MLASPCTLTRTATGFNVNQKGGEVIATKDKIRQIELAKKSQTRNAVIGTTHALDILGELSSVNCPLHKKEGIGWSAQTGPCNKSPQYSEAEKGRMPPPTQHTEV